MDKEIEVMSFVNDRKDPYYEEVIINNNGKKIGVAGVNKSKFNSKRIIAALGVSGTLALTAFVGSKLLSEVKLDPNPIISPVDGFETEEEELQETKYYSTDYLVKSGDNLYNIVASYAPTNLINQYISEIKRINGLKSESVIQTGSVVTLINVPEDKVAELNTGYNPDFEYNQEEDSTLLHNIQFINESMNDVATGSLVDTLNKNAKIYQETTNPKVKNRLRIYLSETSEHILFNELGNHQEISDDDTPTRSR